MSPLYARNSITALPRPPNWILGEGAGDESEKGREIGKGMRI